MSEATESSVLVCSCDPGYAAQQLVEQILGTSLPEPCRQDGDVVWYPWTISNKYYRADVSMCVVPSRFEVSAKVAESVQACILYFSSAAKDGLSSVAPWLPVVEELAPEVLILVCDHVCDAGVSRKEAQQWCLAHAFEMVELNTQELPEEDDDFPESTGVKRIIQALNANVWSSAEMKDETNQGFGLMSSLMASCHAQPQPQPPAVQTEDAEKADQVSTDPVDAVAIDPRLDMDIQELATLTAGDSDVDNFERLFTKLKEMKDKASSLPHDQRKLHAEKVAKAFWTAIGGEDDEVDCLSSGEES
ncbi:alpha- and gamma-adaptin-binding protein p34-like [Denticeps clupeoides]|uniref:alpha- and gamma-adaptin-binding protein p34-like n=1 Tax=Denticeps clupeoides TaxID=299321 RepID=UPI0010A4E90F|nr:alpha- and gamma-adaptin-binding protein p34-like [Denticeps clupeoides]